jgi:deoxyribonuclease IV
MMHPPFQLGLKLHSTNIGLIADATSLWEEDVFQYIELYVVPDSYLSTIDMWKNCQIPFIIHAPHSFHGINLAIASQWKQNRKLFEETQKFADKLHGNRVIVHGGHTGNIEETIRQASQLDDPRVILENKPKVGINDEICVGWSPDEFRKAQVSSVFAGFVLDFGHAACAAFSIGKKPMDFVTEFLAFEPEVFHLSDGDQYSEKDTHYNIGKGNLELKEFLCIIPQGAYLTLEIPCNYSRGLEDFVKDTNLLKSWKYS